MLPNSCLFLRDPSPCQENEVGCDPDPESPGVRKTSPRCKNKLPCYGSLFLHGSPKIRIVGFLLCLVVFVRCRFISVCYRLVAWMFVCVFLGRLRRAGPFGGTRRFHTVGCWRLGAKLSSLFSGLRSNLPETDLAVLSNLYLNKSLFCSPRRCPSEVCVFPTCCLFLFCFVLF